MFQVNVGDKVRISERIVDYIYTPMNPVEHRRIMVGDVITIDFVRDDGLVIGWRYPGHSSSSFGEDTSSIHATMCDPVEVVEPIETAIAKLITALENFKPIT